ncbi:MAG: hypothetical protein WAM14_27095, partial [Candidatus Nitrosopolaris sp.]
SNTLALAGKKLDLEALNKLKIMTSSTAKTNVPTNSSTAKTNVPTNSSTTALSKTNIIASHTGTTATPQTSTFGFYFGSPTTAATATPHTSTFGFYLGSPTTNATATPTTNATGKDLSKKPVLNSSTDFVRSSSKNVLVPGNKYIIGILIP